MKILTESGLPIDRRDVKKFRLEWRELYDKAQAKCESATADATGHKPIDMVRLNALLGRLDRIMRRKYPNTATADYPATPEAMSDLMNLFGCTLWFGVFENELTCVIRDGAMGLDPDEQIIEKPVTEPLVEVSTPVNESIPGDQQLIQPSELNGSALEAIGSETV